MQNKKTKQTIKYKIIIDSLAVASGPRTIKVILFQVKGECVCLFCFFLFFTERVLRVQAAARQWWHPTSSSRPYSRAQNRAAAR